MNWGSQEAIAVLSFLLPGFVAAWIFHGLTPYLLPSPFERVVKALIFTVLIQGLVVPIREMAFLIGHRFNSTIPWGTDAQLVASVVTAIALGLGTARWANNDRLHRVLRRLGFTRQTSYASEWFWAFAENPTFVVLHLDGERRLYGWPEQWPSSPEAGHFAIAEAEWLTDDGRIPLPQVEHVLIPGACVQMVEFVQPTSAVIAEES